MEQSVDRLLPSDTSLDLQFEANRYGPYANRLEKLLDKLDGSYLHCDKRIADADKLDVIWFDDERKDLVQAYLRTEAKAYAQALEETAALIDGFESPFGMELLATVDWLLTKEGVEPEVQAVRKGLQRWPKPGAAQRKLKLFHDEAIGFALERLTHPPRQAMAT